MVYCQDLGSIGELAHIFCLSPANFFLLAIATCHLLKPKPIHHISYFAVGDSFSIFTPSRWIDTNEKTK